MAKGKASTGTPATTVLAREKVEYTAHTYELGETTLSYGEAVAQALGVEPGRMFKTLVATVDGRLAVGVVPVAGSLDLKALAMALGGKRGAMAEPAAAERATGYVTGGISPVGQRTRLPIVVDESVSQWTTVFVSGGRRGLQIELAPADLVRIVDARRAPIAGL